MQVQEYFDEQMMTFPEIHAEICDGYFADRL